MSKVKEIRCITNTNGYICNTYLGDMPVVEGEKVVFCRKKTCRKHWKVRQDKDGNLFFSETTAPAPKDYDKTGVVMEEKVG